MSRAETYDALARLLDYPEDVDVLLRSLWRVACHLDSCELECPALPFAEFLGESSLAELQEEYVGSFDFNPAKAPYLGHHLFGDSQGKADYMIKVKKEYARFSFTPPGVELPDHLPVLLSFLAFLSRENQHEPRRRFISEKVLPGVRKMLDAGPSARSSWFPLIETAEVVLSADCREVPK